MAEIRPANIHPALHCFTYQKRVADTQVIEKLVERSAPGRITATNVGGGVIAVHQPPLITKRHESGFRRIFTTTTHLFIKRTTRAIRRSPTCMFGEPMNNVILYSIISQLESMLSATKLSEVEKNTLCVEIKNYKLPF